LAGASVLLAAFLFVELVQSGQWSISRCSLARPSSDRLSPCWATPAARR
jgi:hypothetical protein